MHVRLGACQKRTAISSRSKECTTNRDASLRGKLAEKKRERKGELTCILAVLNIGKRNGEQPFTSVGHIYYIERCENGAIRYVVDCLPFPPPVYRHLNIRRAQTVETPKGQTTMSSVYGTLKPPEITEESPVFSSPIFASFYFV